MRTCFIIGCIIQVALAELQGAGLSQQLTVGASVVRADPLSGRLVRSYVSAKSHPKPTIVSGDLTETVDRIARQNQLSPQLIHSVIKAESNYDPYAISSKGALGLMQLIPSTARRFGVSDVFNPSENIQGGARYLKYLLELYKGDKVLALAAYNAGEGAVLRYGGVPPFPETQNYVTRVRKHLEEIRTPDETAEPVRAVQRSDAKPADAVPAEAYNPIREVTEANGRVRYVSR